MKLNKLLIFGVLLLFIKFNTYAQSLPVGSTMIEDFYRRQQLSGLTDSAVSFTIRPLFPNHTSKQPNVFYPDSGELHLVNPNHFWESENKKLTVTPLPATFQTQFNSHHPYGWNDGAMIPAKGMQTLISGGFFAKFGMLTVQFKPELVIAANSHFETFNSNQYDVIFARYYDIYNNIDLPVRFGTEPYAKLFWGQSSIRLNYKALSFGLSTENLWWGPGIRNSLLMSNSAPGFKHITLNTLHPIKTAIGSFEGQFISGLLGNSNFAPLEPDKYYFGTNLYVNKPDNWRYLTGIIVTWQPKWIPGLFLGYDQAAYAYGKDLSSLRDYLPLFSPIKFTSGPNTQLNKRDELSSFFMRWLWPEEKAEIYFEFGNYNNSDDFAQFLLDPSKTRAYIFGLRKPLPLNNIKGTNILIGVEVTQLQGTSLSRDQLGLEWYVSQNVRQGYTNDGQPIGAGIGPGGNLQSIEVSWVKGLKRIGFQIERYVHDNDFYYYAFSDSKNYSQHWVDVTAGFNGEWNYKNLIFNARILGTNSLNYQWALTKNGNDPTFSNQLTRFNLQAQAGITYRF